jgi:bifunctional non-homologous end joining protein LigD
MVFDLDPDEGVAIAQLRQGVLDLKTVLDKLKLCSFLKTSGNKGYHVVVPFRPCTDWETFSLFAKQTVRLMEAKWPELYTSNVRKASRKGRIFIDWIRNGPGATSIAPYSIRAKNGARVSMPIAWEELESVAPNSVTMQESLTRIKKPDPWARFFRCQEMQTISQYSSRQ